MNIKVGKTGTREKMQVIQRMDMNNKITHFLGWLDTAVFCSGNLVLPFNKMFSKWPTQLKGKDMGSLTPKNTLI